jgi:preprotein translocase subunit SecG
LIQVLYFLYAIHVIVSIFLILVVLLQQGKGADLSVFGGGSTQAAFGARGAATLLHKLTVGGFVLFVVTTLSISLMKGKLERGTVMTDAAAQEEPAGTPAGATDQGAATDQEGATDQTAAPAAEEGAQTPPAAAQTPEAAPAPPADAGQGGAEPPPSP